MLSRSALNRRLNNLKQRAKRREDWINAEWYGTLRYQLKHGMSVGLVAIHLRRYYVSARIPECYGWKNEKNQT
jgi:hypothetical protein